MLDDDDLIKAGFFRGEWSSNWRSSSDLDIYLDLNEFGCELEIRRGHLYVRHVDTYRPYNEVEICRITSAGHLNSVLELADWPALVDQLVRGGLSNECDE